ncbi:KAT8 regulatory NSL complex subunit 2 isoform X2 [Sitophilus oryzae]|uniref:KAT8 regulatory NSL complex subunit 2 n=1 Tax=Sitophilus oryzae TaxID=7048 RepID=A0A6J2YNX5_SITOR|nr:KAT8 regulatory NSL complex subunit 2 isoform X2 [Sitophilus oryzae]
MRYFNHVTDHGYVLLVKISLFGFPSIFRVLNVLKTKSLCSSRSFKINLEMASTDSMAELRAQLELEIKNKKQCDYESYQCTQLTIDGYKYCLRHILNDKNAPFKQCNYIYQNNGKRCHLPAPKGEKKEYGYCNEHALKSTIVRNKQNAKNPPPLSTESLLTKLSHYVRKPRNRTASSSSYISDEERNYLEDNANLKATKSVDPFVDIDANSVYTTQCNEVLDMCSESESDVEPSTLASVWPDVNADSSDNESIDSEEEDVLKHANVYTAEEISLLTRDKLVRLQSLYIEQYRYLQHVLREKRRKYLHSLRREKETCCNIYNQVKDNPKEQRLYRKLKQYIKYHHAYGQEAILSKRLHDIRAKISDGLPVRSGGLTKCTFSEGGVKCGEKVLPMARHCRRHILEDQSQVLFKACGKANGDIECNTPVEAIFDDSTCKLHVEIPPIRSYHQPRTSQGTKRKRKESESDIDDTLELPPHYAMPTGETVKTEMLDYSLPQDLPKMETLPSLLFEDSTENLPSSLQFTTSTFNDSFNEQTSSDLLENSASVDLKINVTEDENTDGEMSNINASSLEDNSNIQETQEEIKEDSINDNFENTPFLNEEDSETTLFENADTVEVRSEENVEKPNEQEENPENKMDVD